MKQEKKEQKQEVIVLTVPAIHINFSAPFQ